MAIILRNSKSVPLTFTELDGNFSDLNQRVQTLETAEYVTSVNSVTPTSGNIALTSANISEQTNLYFTDARARGSISVTDTGGDGSLTYSSSTGVLTYTGPSANEVRAHFSAGNGISISTGSIAIDTNGVNTTHIDFGTGANQVNTDLLPQGSTNLYYSDASVDTRIAASSIDVLSDVNTTGVYAPTSNQVLTWTGSSWNPATPPGAAGGEANNIVQVGTGKEIFYQKNGVDFQLRRIQGDSNILVQDSGTSLLINMTSSPTFGNIQIKNNTIENTTTNNDINITPNGTGAVVVSGDLNATLGTAAQPNITSIGTLAADLILGNTHDIVLQGSSFTTTVVNADPSENRTITLPDATGTAITTGNLSSINQLASTVTGNISFSGDITVASANIDNLSINNNTITNTVSNQNLTLVANGTGSIDVSTSKIINLVDPTSNQDAATKAYVDSQISQTSITQGNSNVTVTDSGTGQVVTTVDGTAELTIVSASATFGGNIIIPDAGNIGSASDNDAIAISSDGVVALSATTASTSSTTGALTVAGGVGVADDLFVGDDIELGGGILAIKNAGVRSVARFYCEVSNLHYAEIQAPAHADFAGNITLTLPATTDTLVGKTTTDTLTNKTLTAPVISATSTTVGGKIKFLEGTDNGTNGVTLVGAASTADIDVVLPSTAGTLALQNEDTTGTAAIATTVTVADESSDTTCFPLFGTAATGNLNVKSDASALTYNSANGTLAATIFSGVATSAQYADVAENYLPDASYKPGTVVSIGGEAEVTLCGPDDYVAGVVSTNPAYLMNREQEGGIPIALVGRVPVRVVGTVEKGDPVFADKNGIASKTAEGPLVGIALQGSIDPAEKLIECMLKV